MWRGILSPDFYRRLASDLTRNGSIVVTDLSGEELEAAVEGGAGIVKVSDEDLHRDGQLRGRRIQSLVKVLQRLGSNGQRAVICTRAERPAVASFNVRVVEVFDGELGEYFHPRKAILAGSQGSMQLLANDNAFVG